MPIVEKRGLEELLRLECAFECREDLINKNTDSDSEGLGQGLCFQTAVRRCWPAGPWTTAGVAEARAVFLRLGVWLTGGL